MKKNILILAVLVGLISIGYLAFLLTTNENTSNSTKIIEQNIVKLKNENSTAKFADITPFVWDKAFIIKDPFLDEEALDRIVGVKCNLDRLETDIKRRIIFVNEGEFVFDYIYDIREFMYKYDGTTELTKNSSIIVENGTNKIMVLRIEQ
ncbi:hypothetical protein [Paenibacillus donghaensis]|uniref:Uncharacterized protein n=1 Tax=Paenibacillus donghaensis TaxID=414771 RepID=A0A2Z2KQB3_9BACL|nr:hypothetical protein [Paenibacillus donghaensis]ASA25990.1 hypothetical protein B9T62_37950 [Paenibacillus donghaensis]